MFRFAIDVLTFYFSGSLWGAYLIIGFCTLCLAGVIDFIWSFGEV